MSDKIHQSSFDIADLGRLGLINFCIFAPSGHIHSLSHEGAFGLCKGQNLFDEIDVFEHIGMLLPQLIKDHGSPFLLPNVTIYQEGDETYQNYCVTSIDAQNLYLLTVNQSGHGQSDVSKALRDQRSDLFAKDLMAAEKARFDMIYRTSPVLGFALDAKGHILAMTDRFTNFFGEGHSFVIADLAHTIASYRVSSAHDKIDNVEVCLSNSFHAPHIFELSAFTIENQSAKRIETYCILNDITAKWASERALANKNNLLAQATQRLSKSNAKLQDFAHIAAHDLVAPIGRIKMLSDMIERETLHIQDNASLNFALSAIGKTSIECIQTVQSFLEYARVKSMEARFESLSLADAIATVFANVANQFDLADSANLDLPLNLPLIQADRHMLGVILRNTITNTFKYRKDNETLKVSVRVISEDDLVSITLSDNGKGFTMRDNVDPFDRFSRMDSAARIQGTGLGLAMVQETCGAQNWHCAITSIPGSGTSFTVSNIKIDRNLKGLG